MINCEQSVVEVGKPVRANPIDRHMRNRRLLIWIIAGVVTAAVSLSHPARAVDESRTQIRSARHVIGREPQRISFVNDVVPVLTRAGCNQGTCHGAAAGKNGFRLSLRGYAPEIDFHSMTRQLGGRRINRTEPHKSLLLRKPLAEVAHMGGKALIQGSSEHAILCRWLENGAPGPDPKDPSVRRLIIGPAKSTLPENGKVQLKVTAVFSNGSQRDVTHWARFGTNDENIAVLSPAHKNTRAVDGLVQMVGRGETSIFVSYQDRVAAATVAVPFPHRVEPSAYARLARTDFVDDLIYRKLAQLRIWPSSDASDLELCRRLYLDLTGTLPSPEVIKAFGASRDPKKYEKLIDTLMSGSAFAEFWTYKWSDLFRVNRGTLKDKGMWAYYGYIHNSVRTNRPWNQVAREILTATGNTFLDGPANYFRTALKPEELAENVSQGFMGIRVNCARCHNHPLEKWTQNEYYGMAQLFARVKYKADLSIHVNEEMTVYNTRDGDLIQPRLGRPVPPKPLGGPVFAMSGPKERRRLFADWLTRPENPYFARVMANRVWKHFMGRGLVEQVDDLRETNPPTNPELLGALEADFAKHGFDVRHLMRRIVLSRAYQRSSRPEPRNARDDRYYSRFLVKRLTAEQLLDAVCQVTGAPEQFPGMPVGMRAIQLPDTQVKSDFMDSFGRPARQITCECERSQEPSMAQALLFINGELINRKVTADKGPVDRMLKEGRSDSEIMETLYWTALGRPPAPSERNQNSISLKRAYAASVHRSKSASLGSAALANTVDTKARRSALEDLFWVLLNSKEFLFNH